jgi:chromodomain-helicase-DNA-binding protein 1
MAGFLCEAQAVASPLIVVVPLSVVPNWAREFRKWVPQVNCVVYVGDAASRAVIRHFEFPPAGRAAGRTHKFDVLITTYEIALKDAALLRGVRWGYLMVDEAHRLKNDESALYKASRARCCLAGYVVFTLHYLLL